jgi:D-3-phosphoglycerate dehydrogenase
MVAEYVRAMGATVVASDPAAPGTSPLEDVLGAAEVVSLHANLTAETRGLMGRAQFAAMRRGAWLVNTARGELVDEEALLDALESRKLAGAALDVLADEDSAGMGHHRLVRYARERGNLLLTPHIGGCTVESMEKTERFLAEKLVALL